MQNPCRAQASRPATTGQRENPVVVDDDEDGSLHIAAVPDREGGSGADCLHAGKDGGEDEPIQTAKRRR